VALPGSQGPSSQAPWGQTKLNGAPAASSSWGEMPWPGSGQIAQAPSAPGPTSTGPTSTGPTGNAPTSNAPTSNAPTGNGPTGNGPTSNGHGPWRPAQPGARQIPTRAALVAVPGALGGIVLAGVGAAIGQSITGSSTSALSDLLGEAGLWVAMLATVVLVSHRFGTSSLRRDYGLAFTLKDPLWGVCAAITAFLGAGLILEIFSGTKFSGSNDQILTQQKGHDVGIVLITVIVAIGAPFFEELFFRGFLRTALQARFGRHGAVWLQAVFFGLAHAGEAGTALGNVSVVLAMFTVGVVLGYTAMLTGRLGAGMVAHCLFNLVAVISVV
jgi:membrane protease YdiL (CAAX protease family)